MFKNIISQKYLQKEQLLNKQGQLNVIYTDFQKVFKQINRDILLQ